MKKTILSLFIISLLIISCKNQSKDIVISGKIENPVSKEVTFYGSKGIVKKIKLNDDNTFRDTLKTDEGFYKISHGKESSSMYLKPSFNLNVTLDTKQFDETITYTGKGETENNYLAKKLLLKESFGKLNYYGYYAKLNEQDFLKLTDSLHNVYLKNLNDKKELDKDFSFTESKNLEFKKLVKYASYERMKRYVTKNKDFKVSENFPNAFKDINLSDEKLLDSPIYLNYLVKYFQKKASKNFNKNADFTLTYLKVINDELKNPIIKDELLYTIGKYDLPYAKNLESVYSNLKNNITNKEYLSEVTEAYNRIKKTEKGSVSPTFTFNDINGESVSLNNLRGKLVYIDLWATWCMPCRKEIPFLQKIEEEFKGKKIHFVSICKSDTKENWKAMVKKDSLGGIQLFAPDNEHPFFKDYMVQGIPRFILIDQEGKIIDAKAKRPSNPKLKEDLKLYLED